MRIPKLSVLSFALALAISLPAAAQSPAANPSSQSAPAQTAPPVISAAECAINGHSEQRASTGQRRQSVEPYR